MASQQEPIILENKYPFKSHRYLNYRTYVSLTPKQQNEIRTQLRKIYPIGTPGRDIIKKYIQKNSCDYCLCYGHTIDPTVFPTTCPNIEPDYNAWLIEMARKYDTDLTIMNFHVMTGIGITPSKYDHNIPKWSRYDFEQQLCQKYSRYRVSNEPKQNVFVHNRQLNKKEDNHQKILAKL